MKKTLPPGKLDFPLLESLLRYHTGRHDSRVIKGPAIGGDTAVIDYPDRYLIVKTDPITFATDQIGWYAVNINANDIACTGATPKFFLSTILLPHTKTDAADAKRIFSQIARAARDLQVSVIGGHTEVTYGIDRAIVVGTMLGEVAKDKLVLTSGAKPGDDIILTKGIVIEGTAVIAREKYRELKKSGYTESFLRTCQNFLYNPGLSVVEDARVAAQIGVHAMHDPTEGGLSAGLYEMAQASGTGMRIDYEKIPILKESVRVCREYHLDPLRTISSGALLIAASKVNSQNIIASLQRHNIHASVIGEVKEKNSGFKMTRGGITADVTYSANDEITKIFS